VHRKHGDSAGLSGGIVLSGGYSVGIPVSVSQRNVWCDHGLVVCRPMHTMHSGNVLRVYGSDGSFGSLSRGLLLRRRQLCGDSHQERVWLIGAYVPRELLGRHMCGSEECDGERHLSSGALLSGGELGSVVVSSGHELVVDGSDVEEPVSSLCEGLLLSEQRHGDGDSSVLGRVLLSVRNCEPEHELQYVVSSGIVLSCGQCDSDRMCGGILSEPTRQQHLQGLSCWICVRRAYGDSAGLSGGIVLSGGYSVGIPVSVSQRNV